MKRLRKFRGRSFSVGPTARSSRYLMPAGREPERSTVTRSSTSCCVNCPSIVPSSVIRAIADGRKIEAIKILRESTGLGLANAKVLVDRASRVHGPKKTPNSAVDPNSGSVKLIVSAIALLGLLAAYFYMT